MSHREPDRNAPRGDANPPVRVLKECYERHLTETLAQDEFTATTLGRYNSLALAVRNGSFGADFHGRHRSVGGPVT